MIQAVKVPEIGENVESGVVVAVHIKDGDMLAVDDTVIELETDKALVEIPSPFSGRVIEVLAREGSQMNVGDVIARVETDAQPSKEEEPAPEAIAPAPETEHGAEEAAQPSLPPAPPTKVSNPIPEQRKETHGGLRVPASPSIRRLARELGVEIVHVSGSGPGGRINEADIKTHVRHRLPGTPGSSGSTPSGAPQTLPDFSRWGQIDTEEMDTVRRLTARSTAGSWATIPHVTQFDEADISTVMAFIQKNTVKMEKAGAKLTVTAIITRVCAEALKRFPHFNASIDMTANRIILKRYINIGIAADTPRGLLVPVIRHADQRSLVDLALSIGDLSTRARSKKLKPDEMEGGTFTISNQGGIGGVGFTPIVLWPQVAILGVSRSAIKPVYIEDRFEPRTILPLSLSYDHRIIDGADAAGFLRWICDGLEQAMTLFLD